MRRRILIIILFFAGTSFLPGQNNFKQEDIDKIIHPVGTLPDTVQDSIVVELTAFQKQELLGIDEQEQKLKQQYEQALHQLQQIRLNKLTWIADANRVKIEDVKDISRENPDKIIFKLKKQ